MLCLYIEWHLLQVCLDQSFIFPGYRSRIPLFSDTSDCMPAFPINLPTQSGICYICNMGSRDLPDMYARAQGRMRTYQANPNRTCFICYVTLPALKPAELAIHCAASLYNNLCRL